MKRILSIFFGASVWLLMPLAALAATVTTTAEFSITLPSNGEGYTVRNQGTFNNLDVSGGTFTLTLDPTDQTIFVSSQKRKFANNRNIGTQCNANDSRLVEAVATTGVQVIDTITPSGTCTAETAATSGGGSGGGSGGASGGGSSVSPSLSPSPTPTATTTATSTPSLSPSPTPSATPQPHALLAPKPAVPASSVAASVSPVIILRTMTQGSRGNDVALLQKFLATDKSIYPEGIVSGFFGSLTRVAVERFQEKYGIATKGKLGYGLVGPKTRAKLKEVSGMPVPSPSSLPTIPPPSRSAVIADLQAQIKVLQLQIQIRMIQDSINKLKKK